MPAFLKPALRRTAPGIEAAVVQKDIDWQGSQAFGCHYVSGVYVNDRARFGGPVDGAAAVASLTRRIVDEFNATDEAREREMRARPYRSEFPEARCAALLPDVWIDCPSTVFFEGRGPFVQANPRYGPIEDLRRVDRDVFTGVKGRKPVFCGSRELSDLVEDRDPGDMTLAYRIIERAMAR
jgi:hypothetical protein